jgi:hypothetical protein
MTLLKHALIGFVLPVAMLLGLVWWRATSMPVLPILTGGWWVWYVTVITVSIFMGASMHRYWTQHQDDPPIKRRQRH